MSETTFITVKILLFAILITFLAWIIPVFSFSSYMTAIGMIFTITILNTLIYPVIRFMNITPNIFIIGLSAFILNTLLIFIFTRWTSLGINMGGFLSLFISTIVLTILSMFLNKE